MEIAREVYLSPTRGQDSIKKVVIMKLREARESDLDAICEIYNREVRDAVTTFTTAVWHPADQRDWLAQHGPPYPILVAEDGQGQVKGWACINPWSPKGGYRGTVEASAFVDRQARRRGIGEALIRAILRRAADTGYNVMLGRVESSNRASLKLLSRLGFQTIGTMHGVGEKFGRRLDVVMVEFDLRGLRPET